MDRFLHATSQHSGLHGLFWHAAKAAGDSKKTMGIDAAPHLIYLIEQIGVVFWNTEEAKSAGLYPPR